ncbi:hypothetical protein F4818DRAFT_424579 [Hypoxylon cercidicola]|nr:hypothetical protein F4818DRAFT_424579 [Hypoxylon cercidicola]
MALAEPAGRCDDAFYNHWKDHKWSGQRQETRESRYCYPVGLLSVEMLTLDHVVPPGQPIRGVVVHTAVEPTPLWAKNWSNLQRLEDHGAAVVG